MFERLMVKQLLPSTLTELLCFDLSLQNVDCVNYLHVKVVGLLFVATLRVNVSPSLVLELLQRIIRVAKDYLGVLNEESLRRNFVLVYELLDEMIVSILFITSVLLSCVSLWNHTFFWHTDKAIFWFFCGRILVTRRQHPLKFWNHMSSMNPLLLMLQGSQILGLLPYLW